MALATMLAMTLATQPAAGVPTTPEIPPSLEAAQAEALVSGLSRRLRGAFLIGGVRDIDGPCARDGRCTVLPALTRPGAGGLDARQERLRAVARSGASDRLPIVDICRTAVNARGQLALIASVYDPDTDRWTVRRGEISADHGDPLISAMETRARLMRWDIAPRGDSHCADAATRPARLD